ncbi:MAG: EamA family transporter [Nitrospirota bacterium]|nr:EamA family transporter [Nitrospirota bacterium]
MHWFYFALLVAISESLKDLCSKQGLRTVSPQVAALAASAIPVPLLLGIVLLTDSIPFLGPQYFQALLIGGTLNVLALFQFMRALQASDLSLAIPFVSFTPIFLLFTSPLLIDDMPDTQDLAGILCIVTGAYLLQIRSTHQGWLAPFRAMISQPGPRRMLSVALIYSITSNFDKIGVLHSSPIFWSLSITSVMTVGFVLMLRFLPRPSIPTPSPHTLGVLIAIGILQAIGLFFHNTALSLGPVPSVIAVKRSSILFATLWGILFLREERGKERLGGAVLMVIGIGILGI